MTATAASEGIALHVLLSTAARYAARGWAVFPVVGKMPATRHGFRDATRDPVEVERLFADHRATGIAVACGESGLLVVDVDGLVAQGTWADIAACHGGHPPTLIAETGKPGGLQWCFVAAGCTLDCD